MTNEEVIKMFENNLTQLPVSVPVHNQVARIIAVVREEVEKASKEKKNGKKDK